MLILCLSVSCPCYFACYLSRLICLVIYIATSACIVIMHVILIVAYACHLLDVVFFCATLDFFPSLWDNVFVICCRVQCWISYWIFVYFCLLAYLRVFFYLSVSQSAYVTDSLNDQTDCCTTCFYTCLTDLHTYIPRHLLSFCFHNCLTDLATYIV